MRKALVAAVGMIGLVVVAGFSTGASAAPKGPTTQGFTWTYVGAEIRGMAPSDFDLEKVGTSLDGTCAGIYYLHTTDTSFPIHGTDTGTNYCANGVSKTTETFVLNAPDANGNSTYSGSGKCVGGTRVHKNETCTFTDKGVFNVKTLVEKGKVTGTDTR